jgi:hypothetical protein
MDMNDRKPEVVRIGTSGARIVAVTQEGIDYIDMAGQEQFINFGECADIERFVGHRDTSADPPYAQIMNTRFEFRTGEALLGDLIFPLMKAGRNTLDLS